MALEALKNKSIGIIIPDFDHGGEEKRALFFANKYVSYFKKVYLFAPEGAQTPLLDSRVQQVRTPIRGYRSVLGVLRYVQQQQIDFIQGHKRTTFPYLLMLEKFSRAKVNFNFDNIYLDKEWLYRFAPTRLYYLSDHMKDHYQRWFKDRENITINMGGEFYTPIPNSEAEALKRELKLENCFVLISLGRLSDQKNQEVTLKALSRIADESIVCLMVGEGPKEAQLKQLAGELNLPHRVQFLGHRSDVAKLLSIADVLVQSSIFEGFPNVFIEAASLALPIITTRVGSYSTLVGDNGIAVAVNDVEAFAEAILEMKANYPRYAEHACTLSQSAYFKEFHKSKMLENYLLQYSKDAQNA
ncbi:glycosyltransferase [Cesiribacter andamanensis]|uniref:GDP-mannose-dependent alpha-(1-6)-phosphatidylinositol dimannoside mannosyltransferase n=1 Tax=Cesiribacter andamanensis AMV16 TaxID=1279009 RepID=M7NLA6_9BACT|nr:glycosyltransferase [Cesiribacter andamanensis]EMR02575.1 GDP-mannose-dependent alpha-(1-6)-phosphatidylinositol dimannoside mannosyltransferase [Cesiribacter andamanensis AMV16]